MVMYTFFRNFLFLENTYCSKFIIENFIHAFWEVSETFHRSCSVTYTERTVRYILIESITIHFSLEGEQVSMIKVYILCSDILSLTVENKVFGFFI